MKRILELFLYCFSFLIHLVQVSAEIDKGLEMKNYTDDSLPQEDILGNSVTILEMFLNKYAANLTMNTSDACVTQVLNLEGLREFAVNQQPFGDCPYCCTLNKSSNYINLYFTNKKRRDGLTILKAIKRRGLFKSAGIKRDLYTIIFVHGFTQIGKGHTGRVISDGKTFHIKKVNFERRLLNNAYNLAYFSREEDYNIILVDWKDLAAFPWYYQAVKNTRIVAKVLAHILRFYNNTGEIELSKVHIIGFSLGAQIAGFIGKHLKGLYKIDRITGLDPAFPLFPLRDVSQRLSKSDANFVDVIHTNGGWFGFPISLGHADFYPNGGGILQPGCQISDLIDRGLAQQIVSCSHFLAVTFYAESVRNPMAFPATKCTVISRSSFRNCGFYIDGYMGFSANKSSLGNFYLTTDNHSLFAKSIY